MFDIAQLLCAACALLSLPTTAGEHAKSSSVLRASTRSIMIAALHKYKRYDHVKFAVDQAICEVDAELEIKLIAAHLDIKKLNVTRPDGQVIGHEHRSFSKIESRFMFKLSKHSGSGHWTVNYRRFGELHVLVVAHVAEHVDALNELKCWFVLHTGLVRAEVYGNEHESPLLLDVIMRSNYGSAVGNMNLFDNGEYGENHDELLGDGVYTNFLSRLTSSLSPDYYSIEVRARIESNGVTTLQRYAMCGNAFYTTLDLERLAKQTGRIRDLQVTISDTVDLHWSRPYRSRYEIPVCINANGSAELFTIGKRHYENGSAITRTFSKEELELCSKVAVYSITDTNATVMSNICDIPHYNDQSVVSFPTSFGGIVLLSFVSTVLLAAALCNLFVRATFILYDKLALPREPNISLQSAAHIGSTSDSACDSNIVVPSPLHLDYLSLARRTHYLSLAPPRFRSSISDSIIIARDALSYLTSSLTERTVATI